MNKFKDGWFTEANSQWDGQAFSLKVKSVLHSGKTKFQDIFVADTERYGRMLALDGIIQCTEKDQAAYQEMIAFLPLNSHPNPKKILIIGGGDGGVAREVVKHPAVESVDLCEIDEGVINVSKECMQFMSSGLCNPKVTVHIEDGHKFIKDHPNEYDVIITDSSDPLGPAETLFKKEYYENLKKALRPGGITCSQGETFWMDLKLISEMRKFCKEIFSVVEYSSIYISTYPCGQIGFLLCSTSSDTNFREPCFTFDEEVSKQLEYYSAEIHNASFVMPAFVKRALDV